jgi:hypothetical protein
MSTIERAILIITGYADAAEDFARHAETQAEVAKEPIARRLWEAEGTKERAIARAYRTALTEIIAALEENASEAPA